MADMTMSSRLVETMMINVEDFSDSFLTCGTCFSGYDSAAHSAKLLPCSHTVCQSCLERILETQTGETSFRCPICRDTIQLTATADGSGGSATAAAFPPAFIVNQLLDLLASQRRDRVPTCRLHANQELLFCETCDVIFCPDCRGRGSVTGCHQAATQACGASSVGISALLGNSSTVGMMTPAGVGGAALSHNVISFSVAIKRCSEILLYKASLCVQELNSAQDAVTAELGRLTDSSEACITAVESSFAEVKALVDRRQAEILYTIRRLGEEKRRALQDQLALIESERDLVRQQCDNLNDLVDVRSISKGISYLNDKLDTIESLTEPRENAFLRYQENSLVPRSSVIGNSPVAGSSTSGLVDVARCLAAFGRISVSTTYPPLCTARLPDEVHVNLPAKLTVRAFDYHGQPQTAGTDPIVVRLTDASGRDCPSQCVDVGDGTYVLTILPVTAGPHKLSVKILSRPIRGSPFYISVRGRQKPRWCLNEGLDGRGLVQPFAVSVIPSNLFTLPSESNTELADSSGNDQDHSLPNNTDAEREQSVLLLDTGNSRFLIVDGETGKIKSPACLVNEALKGQAATGMSLSCQDGANGLWIVNWRANELMLMDLATNEIKQRISSPLFVEPTSVCTCPFTNRVLVADNGAGCVFDCRPCITGNQTASVTPLIGPQDGCTNSSSPHPTHGKSLNVSMHHDGLQDALRRVTGICVTSGGEIVLAAGSEIRIYSPEGRHLGNLYPPLGVIQPPASVIVPEAESLNFLPSFTQRTSTLPNAFNHNLNSAPGSTFTLSSSRHLEGIIRRPPSIGGSMRTTGVGGGHRGTFGGLTMGQTGRSQDAGECLLATHTDRTRSAIIVWPESSWRAAIGSRSHDSTDDNLAESTESLLGGPSLLRQVLRQPYTLEVDPPMRRLAGIAVFSGSRHMVAVDLGGQCAYCIRYA